ncbi:MAG: acyl carrier protein [Lachnospiraceae bacterium]|nr:acyl carrier protein [Lachnospiraceae bacterium]
MFEEIKAIIVETLSVDESKVTMDANLSEDLGADSLDAVELGMAVEDKLGITISDDDMATIKTVADLVKIAEESK